MEVDSNEIFYRPPALSVSPIADLLDDEFENEENNNDRESVDIVISPLMRKRAMSVSVTVIAVICLTQMPIISRPGFSRQEQR